MADDFYLDDLEDEPVRPRKTGTGTTRKSSGSGSRRPSSSSGRKPSGRRSGDFFDEEDYLDYARRRRAREERNGGQNRNGARRTGGAAPSSRKRRKKRTSAAAVIAVIAALMVVVGLLGGFGYLVYQDRYGYSKERVDLNEYFEIAGGSDTVVYLQDARTEYKAHIIDDVVYMPYDTVREILNKRFYFNDKDDCVMYTLADDVITVPVGSTQWVTDKGNSGQEGYPIVRWDGSVLYMALPFVKQHTNFEYKFFPDPNRLQIFTDWSEPVRMGTIKKDTQERISGGVKSAILKDLKSGDRVILLEEMQTWSKIKTEDCVVGYVENKFLNIDGTDTTRTPVTDVQEISAANLQRDGRVSMVWHNIGGVAGNDTLEPYMSSVKSVNVISPTWYSIMNEQGDINSFATREYVDKAHAMGLSVWPALDNFNTPGADHNAFLGTRATRKHVIDQMMAAQETAGFDGINIDFEQVDPSYGQDLVQFFRELSVACHERGIVLSIDNYVTYDFNDYYQMDEQAFFADYVVIMGYDEHYAGSREAGSVASIEYVRYGIQRAMQEVPVHKIVNGVPFYTRLWLTADGKVSSQAITMAQQNEVVVNHGLTPVWDSETAQNYVEYREGNDLYQMWMEDVDSIKAKLDVMAADGIAGVAAWKLSFETPDIWNVIENYLNGVQ